MKSLIEYINESNNIELSSDGNEHGFEYVDLGLPSGTMWATCNVGADTSEDEGLLFQFGRVDGYRYRDKNSQFRTNYQNKQDTDNDTTPLTTSGKVYKANDILDLDDDAAYVNMGGKWRMPTKDELKELVDNTTHNVVTVNGVKGMMFISNTNEHQLFIPFIQGTWYNVNWDSLNRSCSAIWSSQVDASNNDCAYSLYCGYYGRTTVEKYSRLYAHTIRGVFK